MLLNRGVLFLGEVFRKKEDVFDFAFFCAEFAIEFVGIENIKLADIQKKK